MSATGFAVRPNASAEAPRNSVAVAVLGLANYSEVVQIRSKRPFVIECRQKRDAFIFR
jgi:hypothetical protein